MKFSLLLIILIKLCLFEYVYLKLTIQKFADFNAGNHYTSKYKSIDKYLILRRGFSFALDVSGLENNYSDNDKILLTFTYDIGNLKYNVNATSDFMSDKNEWSANVYYSEKTSISLRVFSPTTIACGKYKLEIKLTQKTTTYTAQLDDVYFFFNPFSEDDEVFLKNDTERKEYVLNDVLYSYQGTHSAIQTSYWYCGQFTPELITGALYLLKSKNRLQPKDLGNAALVVRQFSSLINSNDEDGLLVGKWSIPYTPYTSPWEWTSSPVIFDQYYKSGGVPVKYGQCWVFSALLVTICRLFGIPARSITNFNSAHDKGGDMCIDKYFDQQGVIDERASTDSIWNFHVWTEVFLNRHDEAHSSGWQAIDATPQERSDSLMQLGPASVNLTKYGGTNTIYDALFVYSEVNADVCIYFKDINGEYALVQRDSKTVGVILVTKTLGTDDNASVFNNITQQYKFDEGSLEERQIYETALVNTGWSQYARKKRSDKKAFKAASVPIAKKTVSVEFIPDERRIYGANVKSHLKITNLTPNTVYVQIKLTISSIYYIGTEYKKLKSFTKLFKVNGKSTSKHPIDLNRNEYLGKLANFFIIKYSVHGNVQGTREYISINKHYSFMNYQLTITTVDKSIFVNKPFKVRIEFNNQLGKSLSGCRLIGEAKGLRPIVRANIVIKNGAIFVQNEILLLTRKGKNTITFKLSCTGLPNVVGRVCVDVIQLRPVPKKIRRPHKFRLIKKFKNHFLRFG